MSPPRFFSKLSSGLSGASAPVLAAMRGGKGTGHAAALQTRCIFAALAGGILLFGIAAAQAVQSRDARAPFLAVAGAGIIRKKGGKKPSTQRQAIDRLHDEKAAQSVKDTEQRERTFDWLMSCGVEELEKLAQDHKKGTDITGWKNPYAPDDLRSLCTQYGARYVADESRFKDALWCRQTGKDFNGTMEIAIDVHKRVTGWAIASPGERQSLDSLDQCKLHVEAVGLMVEDYDEQREGRDGETLLKSAEIRLSNKSTIKAVPGRPSTVRGMSRNVFITEVDFLEDPIQTIRALLPSITNESRGGVKKLRYVSTPNGVGNVMHKLRTAPAGGAMQWSHHTLNIWQAFLLGAPIDVAALIEAFGDDHEGVRQELLVEFLDGSNVLLPYDLIQQSESMEASEAWDPTAPLNNSSAPTFCGVDFGRQNDPTVCWTLQLIGDTLWTREVLVLQKVETPDQEEILRSRIAAATRTAFDYTGPGIGLGDYLKRTHGLYDPEKHEFGKVALCTFTPDFKRKIFPRLRSAFAASMPGTKQGTKGFMLRIPVSRVIREDLHGMMQTNNGGQYNYWSPRTRNGHSDRCTALALAVHAVGEGAANSISLKLI